MPARSLIIKCSDEGAGPVGSVPSWPGLDYRLPLGPCNPLPHSGDASNTVSYSAGGTGIVRMRFHQPTIECATRRITEGITDGGDHPVPATATSNARPEATVLDPQN